ncbi:MAG: hypothetical protein IH840_16215 [Candidatus Heimdallarchaeota archaeon]|nr:hypothetical protein [Candidatus Heimdallarchaeota archaeon]
MVFNKTDIPQLEWQFFKDLGKQTHKSPDFYTRFNTIHVAKGHIDTMDLAANKLTGLPKSLGNLTELRVLDLRRNGFIRLPASISKLKKLEGIVFDRNGVAIPSSFYELRRNRSRDHNRPLAISFSSSSYSGSTPQHNFRSEIFDYAEALHFEKHYEGVYHPSNAHKIVNSAVRSLKFYKSN